MQSLLTWAKGGHDLPRHILSIDIETETTHLRNVEKSVLGVVGLVPYSLDSGGNYRRGEYRYFVRENLAELPAILKDFDGLILGQNLLNFDYRVLRTHMSLDGIVEKTLDLFFFLESINGTRDSRLSLEVLARRNLEIRKLSASDDISALLRAGNLKQVLRRNERDCDIVAALWIKLISDGRLRSKLRALPYREHFTWPATSRSKLAKRYAAMAAQRNGKSRHRTAVPTELRCRAKDIPILIGQRSFMTSQEWMRRLNEWGNARRDPKTGGKTIIEEPVLPGELALFHRLYCLHCGRNFILRATPARLYRPQGTKVCPFCKQKVRLSKGTTLLDDPRQFFPIRSEDEIASDRIPSEERAREFIRRLRYWHY